jgi:hypothetical protein
MDHTHIVQAGDLERYADTRDSQALIPELIYWLVKQSVSNASVCRIPYGDAVNQPGWDGLVETEEAFLEFVPEGGSYWEIGTGSKPQVKASDDFKKRTDALSDKDRAKASFVFVTPRYAGADGWNGPEQTKWLEHRKDSGWKLIRIIDGVKLADWLREFPSVGRWMAKKINLSKTLCGLNTPAELWETIQARVRSDDPPLPPRMFIEGRESACAALQALFQGKKQRLLLSAESPEDVEEFVSGFLASIDEETCALYSNRCLFISEEEAWHSFVAIRRSHVLIADPRLGLDSDNSNLQTLATKKGHAVVIPVCGTLLGENHEIIKLRSPSQSKLESILTETGYPQIRAKELAIAGADRLSALKRHFLGLGTLPPYAKWDNARFFAQAGLIGKWDGKNQADQTALEILLGKEYGEWIEIVRPDVLRSDTPLIQRNEKWRMVARGEAWNALGSRLTDDDLDRLQKTALQVLGERDPQFDLPKEDRFAASIHGKQLEHSPNLREGIAETLALLGCRPEALSACSQGKADAVAVLTVRGLLESAKWDRWASLDHFLPLLAEAAPDEFLDAVESALENLDESPFHQVFAQEGSVGIGGWNYTSGLLWALETLAWDSDHLTRVVLVLGDLASIDPGGNWANRPSNSLADILLPWHLQTCAPTEKRKSAVETLLQEQPDVGWNLLLALLPHSHGVTSGCRRPAWRNLIPADWKDTVTRRDYWDQIAIYADMAIGLAKSFTDKLDALIDRLSDLPKPAHDNLLAHLASETVTNLPEAQRLPLWEALDDLVRKHRKFAGAAWAMPEEIVAKIEATASALAPEAPELRHHHLFSGRDFDLYDEKGDYEEQQKRLDQLRQNAMREILDSGGVAAALEFARNVSAPNQVGHALGNIATDSVESELLPALLQNGDGVQRSLIGGFVGGRFWKLSWPWADELLAKKWSAAQKGAFLVLLPFDEEVWARAEELLGAEEGLYWRNAAVNPRRPRRDLTKAIEKLIHYDRANAAVQCLEKGAFDPDLAARSLLAVLSSEHFEREFDRHATIEVITRLQKCPSADTDALFKIEWNLLPLLDRFSSGSPKTLENRLASDAAFFCEVIGLVFRSKNEEKKGEEPTEQQRNLARKAYRLLSEWKTPPGIQSDGSFDPDSFTAWLAETKRIAKETGHLDIALSQLGHVLPHVPKDEDGLWIHHIVAQALNAKDAKTMRSGFTTELFNQRGAHVFTVGREELELARINREKAEALEAKRYSRFATAMREFAEGYERDAKREASRDPYEE